MERRLYRRKRKIAAAMSMEQEEASEELGQTDGKVSSKSTSAQERMPTATAPPARIHSAAPWQSVYESCRFVHHCDQSERTEATRITTAAGPQAQGIRVVDHVLLSVTAVI